jgi:hypothetical protein
MMHTKGPWKVFNSTCGIHVLGIGDQDYGAVAQNAKQTPVALSPV